MTINGRTLKDANGEQNCLFYVCNDCRVYVDTGTRIGD